MTYAYATQLFPVCDLTYILQKKKEVCAEMDFFFSNDALRLKEMEQLQFARKTHQDQRQKLYCNHDQI